MDKAVVIRLVDAAYDLGHATRQSAPSLAEIAGDEAMLPENSLPPSIDSQSFARQISQAESAGYEHGFSNGRRSMREELQRKISEGERTYDLGKQTERARNARLVQYLINDAMNDYIWFRGATLTKLAKLKALILSDGEWADKP